MCFGIFGNWRATLRQKRNKGNPKLSSTQIRALVRHVGKSNTSGVEVQNSLQLLVGIRHVQLILNETTFLRNMKKKVAPEIGSARDCKTRKVSEVHKKAVQIITESYLYGRKSLTLTGRMG